MYFDFSAPAPEAPRSDLSAVCRRQRFSPFPPVKPDGTPDIPAARGHGGRPGSLYPAETASKAQRSADTSSQTPAPLPYPPPAALCILAGRPRTTERPASREILAASRPAPLYPAFPALHRKAPRTAHWPAQAAPANPLN